MLEGGLCTLRPHFAKELNKRDNRIGLDFFFFFFFFPGCTQDMWKFLGQGLNPNHSSDNANGLNLLSHKITLV